MLRNRKLEEWQKLDYPSECHILLYPIEVVHYNSSWTALVWSLRPNICVIRLVYEPVAKKRS